MARSKAKPAATKEPMADGRLQTVAYEDIILGENSRVTHLSDAKDIEELALSILQGGFLQPLIVHEVPARGKTKYVLVAGFRRFAAVTKIREGRGSNPLLADEHPELWAQIPVLVVDKRQAKWINVRENIHRKALSIVEQGFAFRDLGREYGLTQEGMAQEAGLARPTVSNAVRVVEGLAPEVLADIQQMPSANHPPANYLLRLIKLDHKAQVVEWDKRKAPKGEQGEGEDKTGGGISAPPKKMRDGKDVREAFESDELDLPRDARIMLQWVLRIREDLPAEWVVGAAEETEAE